jgi:hypothetical protein
MDAENHLLEGKVAQIVSEREIAINIGRAHGVKRGMRFAILAATPQEVRDPDTDELLDTLDRVKVTVEATEVREKIKICSTYKTKRIPGGAFYSFAYQMTEPPRVVPETLRVEDSELPAPLDPDQSYVKIGDRVRQVIDPATSNQ